MPTTITGDADFTLAQAASPTVVVPTPGDPAAANVVRAAVQRTIDYISSIAQDSVNTKTYGVERVRPLTSVASIKDLEGMQTGDVVMLVDPSYIGSGSQGLLSGFGLFVFVEAVTWPQSLVDGVPGAYLVIQPNVGAGRWVNVTAGVGWNVGTNVSFQPIPARRQRQWANERGVLGSDDLTGLAGPTAVDTGILLATGLPAGAVIHLDVDLTVSSPSAGAAPFLVQIECSTPGVSSGAWTLVPSSRRELGGGSSNDIRIPVHLGAKYTAAVSDTYDFRVTVTGDAGQTMTVLRQWSFRGTSYNAT